MVFLHNYCRGTDSHTQDRGMVRSPFTRAPHCGSESLTPYPSPLLLAVPGLPQPPPSHFVALPCVALPCVALPCVALPCVGGPSAPRPSRVPPLANAIIRRLPPGLPSTGRGSARTGWPCGYPRRRLFAGRRGPRTPAPPPALPWPSTPSASFTLAHRPQSHCRW